MVLGPSLPCPALPERPLFSRSILEAPWLSLTGILHKQGQRPKSCLENLRPKTCLKSGRSRLWCGKDEALRGQQEHIHFVLLKSVFTPVVLFPFSFVHRSCRQSYTRLILYFTPGAHHWREGGVSGPRSAWRRDGDGLVKLPPFSCEIHPKGTLTAKTRLHHSFNVSKGGEEEKASCIRLSAAIFAFTRMKICVCLTGACLYSSRKKSGLNLVPPPLNSSLQTAVIKQN